MSSRRRHTRFKCDWSSDVCSSDLKEYGVSPEQVRTIRSDWLDKLAEFLRRPFMAVLLVMIGITCLILELKIPGVGLPGVVAALCFVLFFWSHAGGHVTALAILLFILRP